MTPDLIRSTRPLPQNWYAAYVLVCRATKGLFDKEWSAGENADGFTMRARFQACRGGKSVRITLIPVYESREYTQRHDHLTMSRVFTPARGYENMRVRVQEKEKASCPVVGQHLTPQGVIALLRAATEVAV